MSFYEKYKRPILIGVALFALVTFSVTGVMMAVFRQWLAPESPEQITLADGRTVKLTQDDFTIGRALHQLHIVLKQKDASFQRPGMPTVDMPGFVFEGMQPDFTEAPQEVFALLRRVAIERGIDVADEDVDAVIRFALREKQNPFRQPNQPKPPKMSPLQLARVCRLGSVPALEELVRDAIRISTLVRTEMAGTLDLTDAALAEYIGEERKRWKLSYLHWEGKAFEEELKRQPPQDAELLAWIQEQPDETQSKFKDAVLASFSRVALLYDEADPEDFKDLLADLEISEADIEARYDEDKERLYKKEPPQEETGKGASRSPGGGTQGKQGEDKDGDKKPAEARKPGQDGNGGLLAQAGDGEKARPQEPPKQEAAPQQPPQKAPKKEAPKKEAPKKEAPKKEAPKGAEAAPQPDAPRPQDPPDTAESKQGDVKKAGPAATGQQGPPTPEQAEAQQYVPLTEVRDEIVKKLKLEAALRKLLEQAQKEYDEIEKKREAAKAEKDGSGEPAKEPVEGPAKDGGAPDPDAGKPGKEGRDENGGLQQEKAGGGKAQTEGTAKPSQEPGPATERPGAHQGERKAQEKTVPPPFDLKAWFDEVAKGRKGLVFKAADEKVKTPEDYEQLEGLGAWDGSWTLRSIEKEGALSGAIQRADKGCFIFQLKERQENVLRSIDEIRDEAREAYYLTKADEKAQQEAKDFRQRVREKAEAIKGDETKKLKDSIATKVEERLAAWAKEIGEKIEAKKAERARTMLSSAKVVLGRQIKALEDRLAKAEEQKKQLRETMEKEVDEEIHELIQPVLGEAFTQAAADAEVEAKTLGPFFEDVGTRGDPLFSLRDPGPEKFLQSTGYQEIRKAVQPEDAKPGEKQRDPAAGWVSDVLEDKTNRLWFVVRVDDVQKGGNEAVTRRMLAELRPEFTEKRVRNVLQYGFGVDALRKRYKFETK